MENNPLTKPVRAIFIILPGILILASVLFFAATNLKIKSANQEPKIAFSDTVFNFEKVVHGAELEHDFNFRNEGSKPLVIEKVQPSCGCTGATIGDKKEYSEGECGEVKIVFSTQGREGHIEKHITVFTNDSQNPQTDLSLPVT